MKKIKLGTNFAVFIIFFALALVEAIRNQNWLSAVLFFALGLLSLWADFRGGGASQERK